MNAKLSIGAMLGCGLCLCAMLAGAATGTDSGWKERTESGTVVLRAAGRPPISLVYQHQDAWQWKVLGVAWDGRIWYARRDEIKGEEIHYAASVEIVSPMGVARRIASLPRDIVCIGGRLSPDARYLAYAAHREVIDGKANREPPISVFIMRSDGSARRKVATISYRGEAPGWVYRPSWSPDSTRVALPVRVNGRNRIALVSVASGKTEYLAVPEWADVTCPDWSPDGKSIAYSCEDRRWKPKKGEGTDWTSFRWFVWLDSGGTEAGEAAEAREERKQIRPAAVWVTDLRSGNGRPLTKRPKTDTVDLLPRWSPGGTLLTYARWKWDHDFGDMHYWWLDLRVVQANGTEDRAVYDPSDECPAGVAEDEMSWLPDGRRIVFMGCQKGAEGRATGLSMVRVDGTEAWPLTPGMNDWPKIRLQDATGFGHEDGLLVDSFLLSPDGQYAVASGQLWGAPSGGLWRVPVPGSTPKNR